MNPSLAADADTVISDLVRQACICRKINVTTGRQCRQVFESPQHLRRPDRTLHSNLPALYAYRYTAFPSSRRAFSMSMSSTSSLQPHTAASPSPQASSPSQRLRSASAVPMDNFQSERVPGGPRASVPVPMISDPAAPDVNSRNPISQTVSATRENLIQLQPPTTSVGPLAHSTLIDATSNLQADEAEAAVDVLPTYEVKLSRTSKSPKALEWLSQAAKQKFNGTYNRLLAHWGVTHGNLPSFA
ncbi:MAG: hypothetical protein Q9170_005384 [Blastenia crenularia]